MWNSLMAEKGGPVAQTHLLMETKVTLSRTVWFSRKRMVGYLTRTTLDFERPALDEFRLVTSAKRPRTPGLVQKRPLG
jgi:hypothetical protein